MLSSPSIIIDDACATNSISCEASLLKENVELKAQLELLTSKYGKLEENHEKLSSSHDDLLVSHNVLKLAHEAKVSKLVPHADISTTSTQYAILPCASPCNSSTHNIPTSCDELLSLPCCSNNEASTSSSTCIVTNHVEEIKELKAQVTSLKKDLEKGHEGKSTLDKVLCGQKSPNDKGGLGFNSNNKKSMFIKEKGQPQVKNSAKIICFKCKVEGHHVRSCPLKKKPLSDKQLGKRPQVQPQGDVRPLPKKTQVNDLHVEKSTKKKGKSRCCYLCREKGHLASSCTNGTLSNPILVDDVYSLQKDKVGNVFAKFVGTQSGDKKSTIWVAKPIVTNLLGPNLVGDQQAPI
jgi:Zinc knuckle